MIARVCTYVRERVCRMIARVYVSVCAHAHLLGACNNNCVCTYHGPSPCSSMVLSRKRRMAMAAFRDRPTAAKQGLFGRIMGTFTSASNRACWVYSCACYIFVTACVVLLLALLTPGSTDSAATAVLAAEASTFEAVGEQLFLELHDLQTQRAQLVYQRTLQGRYFNTVGHVLSVYGVYRVVMAAINTALRRVGKVDPVTRSLQIAVDYCGLALDVQLWSQHVSFILVGIMIISSVRSFLIQLTKVLLLCVCCFLIPVSVCQSVLVTVVVSRVAVDREVFSLLCKWSVVASYCAFISAVYGKFFVYFFAQHKNCPYFKIANGTPSHTSHTPTPPPIRPTHHPRLPVHGRTPPNTPARPLTARACHTTSHVPHTHSTAADGQGMYFLSLVLLMRMSMPASYRFA